jgi:neutral ceramidase
VSYPILAPINDCAPSAPPYPRRPRRPLTLRRLFAGFRPPLIALLCLCSAGVTPAQAAAANAADLPVFKAGAATSNITPPIGLPIVGGFTPPPSAHIHDELHVRCLALDDGTTRLAFAVVDSVSVNREVFDEARRLIHEATGLPPAHIMMSATHTHSAVSARGDNALVFRTTLDDYQTFLARRIADGVRRALNHLEPARIGWGAGQVPQHVFNRRWLLKDGKTAPDPFGGQDRAVMNPGQRPDLLKPAGPTNPEVYFISVQSTSGRPIALLANYWLHYVGGTGPRHISADYFAAFCDRIQELLGADRQDPPFVGILSNGPCGDVNNIDFSAPPAPRRAPYEKIRLVANDVAQEVLRVHRTIEHRDWVPLNAADAELELKLRHPSPELVHRAREILARGATASPVHARERLYAERTLVAKDWPETVSIMLQTFRIGELAIAAIPFETFTETGLELKAKSPFKDTFTIELANGGYGYLPTPEQHELGGYETWLGTNRVEKEASRKIVATLLELLAQVK